MARKGKGANLFELLYRDQGKTTSSDGSLNCTVAGPGKDGSGASSRV